MAANSERSGGVALVLAIVGGLGAAATLGTAAGGGITWIRFAEAKLPADQVVAVTPKEELVTVGAVTLTGFGLVGLLAVLVAYLLDHCGTAGTRNKIAVVVLAFGGVAVAIIAAEASTPGRIGALVIAALAAALALFVARRAAAIAPIAAVAAALLWLVTGVLWLGVMTVVAGALAAGLLEVARATGTTFRWFGVSVFLAALMFGALMGALRTATTAKLQSAAVVLTEGAGGGGLSGLFVAETADRVYLADVDHCKLDRKSLKLVPRGEPLPGTGRLRAIPRASVEALAIGTREKLDLAQQRGPQLLAELRARTATGADTDRRVTSTHPCADEGIVDRTRRRFTEPSPDRAERLAERFRPILRFDTGERWRPLKIASLMAERNEKGRPSHRLCTPAEKGRLHSCEKIGGVEDLSDDRSSARAIDFDGAHPDGRAHRSPSLERCRGDQARHLLDCDRGSASAIYYRVIEANGRTYVDYWWFLRFNHFDRGALGQLCTKWYRRKILGCYDHEGDWEGITAVSRRGNAERLAFVSFASHEGVYRYAAAEIELEGTRPRVYSARGSHASYPRRCQRRCRQPYQRLPETNTDGSAPWGQNSARECGQEACLLTLGEKAFNAFGGRWGSRLCDRKGCKLARGPKSPARQRRYQAPWCFNGPKGRLTCDGAPIANTASTAPPRSTGR